jgi:hypothetical protein
MRARLGAAVAALVLVAGCGDGSDPEQSADPTPAEVAPGCPAPLEEMDRELDPALHDELMAMFRRDQAGRLGGRDDEGDTARTERLKEIIVESGWPGTDLVGEDGEDAAWTIAQHSDLDPDFQRCALIHLEAAVAQGVGSPGNLAYLTDRVAAGAGEPQTYGTQMGCTKRGPKPATPLVDPDHVDELRAEAGLPPYDDYIDEMTEACAAP